VVTSSARSDRAFHTPALDRPHGSRGALKSKPFSDENAAWLKLKKDQHQELFDDEDDEEEQADDDWAGEGLSSDDDLGANSEEASGGEDDDDDDVRAGPAETGCRIRSRC